MVKMEDNLSPYLTLVEQGSAPANPASGDQKLYIKTSDHLYYTVNSSGTVTAVGSGGFVSPVVDYVEQTTPLNPITATTEAGANTFITGAGFTADGSSSYMVEVFIPIVYAAAGHAANLFLWEASTDLGQLGQGYSSASATIGQTFHGFRKVTPSSGTRTYSVRAQSDSAAGSSLFCGAGGVGVILPAFLRVSKY